MSEFNFNYSSLGEKHQIHLTKDLVKTLRVQARIVLIPFFREISIGSARNEKGYEYPVLTDLAERIIESVFDEGELDSESEEANQVAIKFLSKLSSWQKACLSFYFCSDEAFLNKMKEQNESESFNNDENATLEDLYIEEGKQVQEAVSKLAENDIDLATFLVNELVHLQDILSTEYISNWDASSIVNANENFQEYVGKGQVLIPLALEEFDYWEKLMGNVEEDDE